MEPRSKPLEERELGSVPKGIASWVGSHGQVEPDDSAPRSKLLDRDTIELATLEPDELLVRCAGGGGAISKAQTGADARHPVLFASAKHVAASAATTAICGALTSRHPPIMAIRASLPVTDWLVRQGEQRTNEGPAIRLMVLVADQAAKERQFSAQLADSDRSLVRLADRKRVARARAMSGPEIRIVGGTLVDGTGAPGRPGTLEVRDGRLRLTDDRRTEPAGRTIDATGKVVAPGFIDLHSHSGLMILAEPLHEPKVRQGITTEVIGVDGNSYAPFATQEDLDAFVHLNAGLDGDPRRTHKTKIDWSTVASYLARFDGTVSLNIAYLIGNSPLRIAAVGWEDVPATPSQRARMQSLLREGMEEGAFGLSSGLDYPPGSYAPHRRAGGARTTKPAGTAASTTPTSATRSATASSTRSARRSRSAGWPRRRPTSPTSTTARRSRAAPDQMLDLIDDARKEGLDVTFDAYPHEWASTRLLILIPIWVQAGGPIKTKERLADPNVRNRIRRELQERGTLFAGAGGLRDVRIGYLHRKELLRVGGQDARRADRR